MTEKEIQNYIWDNRKKIGDLLVEIEVPSKRETILPWEITPADIIYNNLLDKFEDFWIAVQSLILIGTEVPLKKYGDSTIRADFLGIFSGRNGTVVVELKKSKQTERQAYTELLAYGSHLRTVFAPMSKRDVNFILISPMQERIVREATIQNLIYDDNFVFALIPEITDNDLTTLKLRPWIPSFEEVDNLINACFSESNFDTFKITWDALPGEWSPFEKGEDPDQNIIDRFNIVSSYAAQLMESKGIHGFVYCSQNWSELVDYAHLINSIILCGINPYKATKSRFLINQGAILKEINEISTDYIQLSDIIPELQKPDYEDRYNYLSTLSSLWFDELSRVGFEIIETMTISTERTSIEKGYGCFDWNSYQKSAMEDVYCHNFDIKLTGLIRNLFFEYSKQDYEYVRKYGRESDLSLWETDIPDEFIEMVTSQHHVRSFIRRLFSDPMQDLIDDINEEFDNS